MGAPRGKEALLLASRELFLECGTIPALPYHDILAQVPLTSSQFPKSVQALSSLSALLRSHQQQVSTPSRYSKRIPNYTPIGKRSYIFRYGAAPTSVEGSCIEIVHHDEGWRSSIHSMDPAELMLTVFYIVLIGSKVFATQDFVHFDSCT